MNIFKSRALLGLVMAVGLVLSAGGFAHADTAAAKAIVDAAKVQGIVGEQGDGYLGIRGSADASVSAAVAEINTGRAAVYADTAAKTGTSPAAAGEASAAVIFSNVVLPGQYYKPLGGAWTVK